jgi:hypothetical protein
MVFTRGPESCPLAVPHRDQGSGNESPEVIIEEEVASFLNTYDRAYHAGEPNIKYRLTQE